MGLDRRGFFTETAQAIQSTISDQIPDINEINDTKKADRLLSTGLSEYKGAWGKMQVMHLLRRTLYGVTQQELASFSSKTLSESVTALLTIGAQPNPPINNYNNRNYTDPNIAAGDTWVNGVYDVGANFLRVASFKGWWIKQLVDQKPNISEKMNLFWHNHFSTQTETVNHAQIIYLHHKLLRENTLGNFKTLVNEVTKNAAMLIYLNGDKNSKTAPDENYARELQELFTLGKGPGSKYTEADVKAAARVLTGWRVERFGVTSYFDATRHDTSDKVFSSFYNNTTVKGKTSTAGANETDELVDMIFQQNEVAMYLCRKLYRFFVYYEIDATTEENVIKPMATIFRNNNYEIKPVLEALFKSEHFFDELNMSCYIKTPLDFIVSLIRQYNVKVPEATHELQYGMYNTIRSYSSLLLQDIGDPPNVAGWPAYYQEPQFTELWINSDTLPRRNQLSDILISFGYKYAGETLIIDALTFANTFDNVTDINKFIDEVVFLLYPFDISKKQKDYLKSILLSGQTQDYYWTDAWNLYKTNPGNTANTNYVNLVLRSMFKYLMNLAEYQLA
jgi:uncharacterized protein (DUF1800 family)